MKFKVAAFVGKMIAFFYSEDVSKINNREKGEYIYVQNYA